MTKLYCFVLIACSALTGAHSQTHTGKPAYHATAPATPAVTAPTAPSTEEALELFRDKVAPDCLFEFSRCTHLSMALDNGGILRVREAGTKLVADHRNGFNESAIDLNKIDLTLINARANAVHLSSKGGASAVTFITDDKPAAMYDNMDIQVYSPEALEVARRAMVYVVERTQGNLTEKATRDFVEAKASRADSTSSPRLFDTLDFITSFLNDHGCADHRWHTQWPDNGSMHQEDASNQGCTVGTATYGCTALYRVRRSGAFYFQESSVKFRQDFANSDPLSVRQIDADLAHENPRVQDSVSLQELANGRMVQIHKSDGSGTFGPFYIDTEENASHLINALTHAIQLCGGKKAAF